MKAMFASKLRICPVCLFALSFLVFGYIRRADAQVLYGSVTGTVTDQSGAGVPKAHDQLGMTSAEADSGCSNDAKS